VQRGHQRPRLPVGHPALHAEGVLAVDVRQLTKPRLGGTGHGHPDVLRPREHRLVVALHHQLGIGVGPPADGERLAVEADVPRGDVVRERQVRRGIREHLAPGERPGDPAAPCGDLPFEVTLRFGEPLVAQQLELVRQCIHGSAPSAPACTGRNPPGHSIRSGGRRHLVPGRGTPRGITIEPCSEPPDGARPSPLTRRTVLLWPPPWQLQRLVWR
jgi:hypothetical protein